MGVRFPSVFTNAILGSVPASGAETIIATSPPFTPPLDSAPILIIWYCTTNIGSGTTTVFGRVRRGTTLSGSVVNTGDGQISVTAGGGIALSGFYFDQTAGQSGQQYSLTIQGVGTTGGFSTQDVSMLVFSL